MLKTKDLEDLREHAKKRAEHLAQAYDIDEGTRDAFISDLTLELVGVAQAFVGAIDRVVKANAGELMSEAQNRKARRAVQAAMRRKR